MKYVITWHERAETSSEYEALQNRILEIFKDWKMPAGCTVNQCLVRVGEFGGYMILETGSPQTDDLGPLLDSVYNRLDPHTLSAFEFKADPVVDVTGAVAKFLT